MHTAARKDESPFTPVGQMSVHMLVHRIPWYTIGDKVSPCVSWISRNGLASVDNTLEEAADELLSVTVPQNQAIVQMWLLYRRNYWGVGLRC